MQDVMIDVGSLVGWGRDLSTGIKAAHNAEVVCSRAASGSVGYYVYISRYLCFSVEDRTCIFFTSDVFAALDLCEKVNKLIAAGQPEGGDRDE